jgi:hypothetical protein
MEPKPLISINYPVLCFFIVIIVASIVGIIYLVRNHRLRKKDYIIVYALTLIIPVINLMSPVKVSVIFLIMILSVIPTLILGTITNFLFKKK